MEIPDRVNDLVVHTGAGQSGPDQPAQGTASPNLSRNALGQPQVQSQGQPATDASSILPQASTSEGGTYVAEIPGSALLTDSDIFSFLGRVQQGARPPTPTGLVGVNNMWEAQPIAPFVQPRCAIPSMPTGNEGVESPPGLVVVEASPASPSQAELGMILKAIQTFLTEIPKIDLGDVATRATRLIGWKNGMMQALALVGYHLQEWWRWCLEASGRAYRRFLDAGNHERESILPLDLMPKAWAQLDSWMRPKKHCLNQSPLRSVIGSPCELVRVILTRLTPLSSTLLSNLAQATQKSV